MAECFCCSFPETGPKFFLKCFFRPPSLDCGLFLFQKRERHIVTLGHVVGRWQRTPCQWDTMDRDLDSLTAGFRARRPSTSVSVPANTRRGTNAVLLLGQRRRRWTNIKTVLIQRFVFARLQQETRGVKSILLLCWASVIDGGLTIKQQWSSASCLLDCSKKREAVNKYCFNVGPAS